MHSLVKEIYAENEWRDGEFAKFKANQDKVDEILWCRMCLPMIYANWEGFVANALKKMLKHLNTLKLTPLQMPTRLTVFGIGDTYRFLSGKQSFEQRCTFTEKFNSLLNETVRFQTKIETKSNLNSSVLEEFCLIFDFNFERFSNLTFTLNTLVRVRNSIAHGENSFILDAKNIEDYIQAVQTAIDILLEEIDKFLTNECYLTIKLPPA